MATFPLGLQKGVEAHELRTGLLNALERIYNVELCIVDQSIVGMLRAERKYQCC